MSFLHGKADGRALSLLGGWIAAKEDELEAIAWATCRKVVAKLKRLGFWQYEASIRGVVQFGPDSGRRVCRGETTKFLDVARASMLKRVGWFQQTTAQAWSDLCVISCVRR